MDTNVVFAVLSILVVCLVIIVAVRPRIGLMATAAAAAVFGATAVVAWPRGAAATAVVGGDETAELNDACQTALLDADLSTLPGRHALAAKLLYGGEAQGFPPQPERLAGLTSMRIIVCDGFLREPDGAACGRHDTEAPPQRLVWILLGEMHDTDASEEIRSGATPLSRFLAKLHKTFPSCTLDMYFEGGAIDELPLGKKRGRSVVSEVEAFVRPCHPPSAARTDPPPRCLTFAQENRVRYTQGDPRGGYLTKRGQSTVADRVARLLTSDADICAKLLNLRDGGGLPSMFTAGEWDSIADSIHQLWAYVETGVEEALPLSARLVKRLLGSRLPRGSLGAIALAHAFAVAICKILQSLPAIVRQYAHMAPDLLTRFHTAVDTLADMQILMNLWRPLLPFLNKDIPLPPYRTVLENLKNKTATPDMRAWYALQNALQLDLVAIILDLYMVARGLRCWCDTTKGAPAARQSIIVTVVGGVHADNQAFLLEKLGGLVIYQTPNPVENVEDLEIQRSLVMDQKYVVDTGVFGWGPRLAPLAGPAPAPSSAAAPAPSSAAASAPSSAAASPPSSAAASGRKRPKVGDRGGRTREYGRVAKNRKKGARPGGAGAGGARR